MVRMVRLAPVRWMMRIMGRYLPDKTIRRSIEDEDLFRTTLSDPEIASLFRAFQACTMTRLDERMPGTLNDMEVCARLPAICPTQVCVPVLAIHGTADRVVPFSQAEQFAAARPDTELMAIGGGEHVCLFTHMHQIRERVDVFIRGLAP